MSLQDVAELASARRPKILGDSLDLPSTADSSFTPTPESRTPPNGNGLVDGTSDADGDGISDPPFLNTHPTAIRQPSFSQSKSVVLSKHRDVHVILPASAAEATSSGSLTSLRRCVVDMSVPTSSTSGGHAFAGLTLRNIRDSLVICGHVNGPAHVTDVQNSVIVTTCRQFRMHDCKDVDVYLLCTSRPIIEDCRNVRFAPLPQSMVRYSFWYPNKVSHHDPTLICCPLQLLSNDDLTQNKFDQVDDFKWLKAEHSPNWSVLPQDQLIKEDVWTGVVPGGPNISLADILQRTVIGRSSAGVDNKQAAAAA
jgi:hypothetical protein